MLIFWGERWTEGTSLQMKNMNVRLINKVNVSKGFLQVPPARPHPTYSLGVWHSGTISHSSLQQICNSMTSSREWVFCSYNVPDDEVSWWIYGLVEIKRDPVQFNLYELALLIVAELISY